MTFLYCGTSQGGVRGSMLFLIEKPPKSILISNQINCRFYYHFVCVLLFRDPLIVPDDIILNMFRGPWLCFDVEKSKPDAFQHGSVQLRWIASSAIHPSWTLGLCMHTTVFLNVRVFRGKA